MALERQKARTMLSYDAARPTRERQSAPQIPWNPNSIRMQRDRVTMMFEARDLAENVGFVKGHLRKVQLYGAGTLVYEPDTGDAGMDSEILGFLHEWYGRAHVGLEHSFTRLVQMALVGMTRDGDSMLVWVRDEDALRLQLVEADQIGELFSFGQTPGYVAGVYRNPDQTRAGYRVYDRVGEMQYFNAQFIDAASANFFFDPLRIQVRGMTSYDTCINNIRDKYELLGYEKIVVKDLSTTGVITYTQRGSADQFDFDKRVVNADGTVSFIQHRESGTREFMGVGEQFQVVQNNRPSPTFAGFIKTLDVEDCHGLNMPYGFLVDPTEPGGASLRLIAHIANREFSRTQNDIVTPNLNRIRDVLLADAMERGEISKHPNFQRGIWMFPPPPTADIQRESDIAIREVRSGLSTYTEQYAIYGQNRARQWRIRKEEVKDKHRLAWEAEQELKAEGVDVRISPDEIAAMSDNPANDPNARGDIPSKPAAGPEKLT
jgi:hypothetical protein